MRVVIGVTGASGSVYAERLTQFLADEIERIYLVFSETGKKVTQHEISGQESILKRSLIGSLNEKEKNVIRVFQIEDYFSPIASGSSVADAMIVVPCSAGCMGRIANGLSTNLIERAADVMLKQRKPLLIALRESPLNQIHLENALKLTRAGAIIVPLMPGFYQKPNSVSEVADFMAGRLVELLGIDHKLYTKWNQRMM